MRYILAESMSHDTVSVFIARRTLREVKQSGAGQVVVDCSYSNIRLVLKAAQAVRKILYHITKIL